MKLFEYHHPQDLFTVYGFRIDDSFNIDPKNFLSEKELSKLNSMEEPKRKNEYLQSRYYVKKKIAELLKTNPKNIDFVYTGEGKPILPPHSLNLDFNISHTENVFIFGITDKGFIGVDIEKMRASKHLDKIAERLFSESELKALKSEADPDKKQKTFFRLWSSKESIVKAFAGGVFKHAHEISINCHKWKIEKLPKEFGDISRWQMYFHDEIKDCIISIVFRQK